MLHGFFFNDTATTEIYTLSLHDALPICARPAQPFGGGADGALVAAGQHGELGPQREFEEVWGGAPGLRVRRAHERVADQARSEEHTSELQSRQYLVCRLLLEKKQPIDNT